jgi:dolichyl-phosphate beta-glucosyltransferase
MSRGGALTSLIFPTYNPGPAVAEVWDAVRAFLRASADTWEVLFVCDGCTDGTPERLHQLTAGSRLPVRVLSYRTNRGKGHAVRRGMLAARGRWRIFADVDLAYGFPDIERVARALRRGADAVIASRDHVRSEVLLSAGLLGYLFRRHVQSRLFGALARLLLPLRQSDTQAGLKGLSAAVAERVVPRLRCDGFGFDCELLTACARMGIDVSEVPVRVRYRDAASTTGWRAARGMVAELFRIRQTWMTVPAPLEMDEPLLELPLARTSAAPIWDEVLAAA